MRREVIFEVLGTDELAKGGVSQGDKRMDCKIRAGMPTFKKLMGLEGTAK